MRLWPLGLWACVLTCANMARAEIYMYVDANGVYAITDTAPPSDAQLIKTLDDGGLKPGSDVTPGPYGIRPATPPETYSDHITSIARAHHIDPDLVKALIWVESAYNPRAVSNKGAKGLMQLIPETAKRFGVKSIFDPEENITGGVKYLRFLLDLFKDDTALSLAAYNAGERAVLRYNGIPPYRETKAYVQLIGKIYGRNLQSAVRTPIYLVTGPDGKQTYTNVPPPPKSKDGTKAEPVLK